MESDVEDTNTENRSINWCEGLGFPLSVLLYMQMQTGQSFQDGEIDNVLNGARLLWPQVEAKLREVYTEDELNAAVNIAEAVSICAEKISAYTLEWIAKGDNE